MAFAAVTFSSENLVAQTSLKHIRGAMTVSAGPAATDDAFGYFVGESYWLGTRLSWDMRIVNLYGSQDFTKYFNLNLDNQLSYNFFGVKNRFYVDGVLGCQVGFDSYSSTIEDLQKVSFMVVGEGGLKMRYYFVYNWSVWLEGKECAGMSQINKYYPQFALGVSWMLPGINSKSAKKFN